MQSSKSDNFYVVLFRIERVCIVIIGLNISILFVADSTILHGPFASSFIILLLLGQALPSRSRWLEPFPPIDVESSTLSPFELDRSSASTSHPVTLYCGAILRIARK